MVQEHRSNLLREMADIFQPLTHPIRTYREADEIYAGDPRGRFEDQSSLIGLYSFCLLSAVLVGYMLYHDFGSNIYQKIF